MWVLRAALGIAAVAPVVLIACGPNEALVVTAPQTASSQSARATAASASAPQALVDAGLSSQPVAEGSSQVITVTLGADGSLTVQGRSVTSDNELIAAVKAARDPSSEARAMILADGAATYGSVIRVMDLLKQAQVTKISFGVAVAPPAAPAAPGEHHLAYRGPIPASCAALDAEINRTLSSRACSAGADCTTGAPRCGCAAPISRAGAAKLSALNGVFDTRGCAAKLPPRPCATCTAPPAVRCDNGQCVVDLTL